MLVRISSLGPYKRTFIPVSDAILTPYEAETVDRLLQRTTQRAPDEPLDYFELQRAAAAMRRAYLKEHAPIWRRQAWALLKKAVVGAGEAMAHGAMAFWNWMGDVERLRRESYLAQASDIYDVERRIRELEHRAVQGTW